MKISKIMEGIPVIEHKMQWFQACIYILNKHWDKVDNFRIDKFLALLRHMFAQAIIFLKSTGYKAEYVSWLTGLMSKLFNDNLSAQGISLQICDVFVPELGKIDKDEITLEQIADLIKPFMHALAKTPYVVLKERITERIFDPLLESNVT